jgi:D-beta-D-heptose 7-phosphate kinase/D-beta-D-heptose 1-phosphate adenosyltransferase
MLDIFVYGDVERISPEAPVPILKIAHEDVMLGGAGNVAVNIASLGAKPIFLSAIGDDDTGENIEQFLSEHPNIEHHLCKIKNRRSSLKTRYIGLHQQLLRADKETTSPINKEAEDFIVNTAKNYIKECGAVILSDYGKGILTDNCIKQIIDTANKSDIPVIVDPKGNDYSKYRGATIVTPNKKELHAASNMPVDGNENIILASKHIIDTCGIKYVLATRSAEGMSLISVDNENDIAHFEAHAKEVFDVSGAGDTVVSCLATSIASGASYKNAANIANIAGGIVVDKIGTATASAEELLSVIEEKDGISNTCGTKSASLSCECHGYGNCKLMSVDAAMEKISKLRRKGSKITFTNGCFDILHPGHLYSFEQAKNYDANNILVIGLNTDSSVKRQNKGEERPINDEQTRAAILSALELVDIIILFDEDTPEKLIEAVRPDVLVKGEDYKDKEIVGADFVKSYGGQVLLAKLLNGHSTTKTVQKLSNK